VDKWVKSGVFCDGCLQTRTFRFFVRWVCDSYRKSGLSRTAVEMADIDIIAFCAKHNGLFLEIASMLFW